VIGAGGALGGYGGNLHLKRELLRAEGIEVGVARVRGFSEVRWKPAAAKSTKPNRPQRSQKSQIT
jgi:hypothetical protein